MMMNYLITGGTGMIGRALIERLSKEDAFITVLTRSIKKAENLLGNHIKLIDTLSINEIEKADVILNLAGEAIADKRWSAKQKKRICQSRWGVTQQLVDLIRLAKNPPRVFISGSAIGIYGRQQNNPINEEYDQFTPEFTHDVCATWEKIALTATTKTRVAIVRTGIVLNKEGGALAKMIPPFKLGLGGKISGGEQMMSWIHIDDMVAALLHIQESELLDGVINLTAPQSVSNNDFSQALAAQLKRPCLFTTPAWLLKLLFGQMADLLLFGQNVVPKKLVDSGFSFTYSNIKQALMHLLQSRP
jgi:uncharacterized protein (TIGR01777 family)